MKILLTVSLLFHILLFPLQSFSQMNYTIIGKVVDENNYLPAGNVIALNPTDSSFITGISFFAGEFELNNIKQKEILLQFTSLEFADTFIAVQYQNNPILDLGEISIQTAGVALDEVVVKGRRPIYTQKADGTIAVLIQNTMLAASNSVEEILSKSPDVIVDEEGAISIFGKGNAILYLNGKRITDNQLSLVSPTNIHKIEIIRNPSSKYDADGAAVIHITTIKQLGEGYQASIQQNITYSTFAGTNSFSSLNFNYNKGRFSTNGQYSLQLGKDRYLWHTTRTRADEAVFLHTDLRGDWLYELDNFSHYGLGMQYDLNQGSYLSVEYSGFLERLGGTTVSRNAITDLTDLSYYTSYIERDGRDQNNSISLNYNQVVDTLGSTLFLGLQYADFNIQTDNLITEESVEDNTNFTRLLQNKQDLEVAILSGQIDYSKIFKNENIIEAGLKYSDIGNDFQLDFLVADNGTDFILSDDLSNNFSYTEAIGAAYFTYKGQLGQGINYSVGVRSEFTDYNLRLSPAATDQIADQYLDFFPNFSITKRFSEDFSTNLSYTSSINRAPYQRLNPVLVYQDRYTSIQGNPELVPEKRHAIEWGNNLKKTNIKLGYNYMIRPFGTTALRGADAKSYVLKRINYGHQHQFFTSISRTLTTDWLTSTNTLSLKYTQLTDNDFGFEEVAPRPNLYFYTNNRIKIMEQLHAELLFWYRGDNFEGLHLRKRMYNLAIALEKSFWDKTLKVRLLANDLLDGIRTSGNYSVAATDIYYHNRWNTDYIRLAITYDFGRLKEVNYKNKEIGKSENARVQ